MQTYCLEVSIPLKVQFGGCIMKNDHLCKYSFNSTKGTIWRLSTIVTTSPTFTCFNSTKGTIWRHLQSTSNVKAKCFNSTKGTIWSMSSISSYLSITFVSIPLKVQFGAPSSSPPSSSRCRVSIPLKVQFGVTKAYNWMMSALLFQFH